MGAVILFNALYSFLCFRTAKPSANPVPLLIVPLIAIVFTSVTVDGGGLLSGHFSWAYVIPTIVNFSAWGCALQLHRLNKTK